MERQNFDEAWKRAFEEGSVQPSESVWTNIELDLEKAKGSQLRRRLAFFQMLAAACVIFAVGVGVGVFVIGSPSSPNNTLALNPEKLPTSPEPKGSEQVAAADKSDASTDDESSFKQSAGTIPTGSQRKFSRAHSLNEDSAGNLIASSSPTGKISSAEEFNSLSPVMTRASVGYENPDKTASLADLARMPKLVEDQRLTFASAPKKDEVIGDPVALMLAKLEQRERELQRLETEKKKKDYKSEQLWTSVGVAAGSFNAVNSGASAPQTASMASTFNNSIANQEAKASGQAYTVGANVGTKISNRWIVQGGVNYLTQSSDYTAHTAVAADATFTSFRPASISELKTLNQGDKLAQEKVVSTAPYNVTNSVRYVSVPMQAGYMIFNRNLGLQLNAGVSTDLFLQNTVTAEGDNINRATTKGGDAPYRAVNFSGLMGTELSYRFSSHYRISLNPGLRYPFSSIYRSNLEVKATPLTFDLGLRFRYIFH